MTTMIFIACRRFIEGNDIGFLESHIESDWLMICAFSESELFLTATRTGIHSDLFDL